MSTRVEVLLATMNQLNIDIVDKMRIKSPVFIANQTDKYAYDEAIKDKNKIRMLSTDSKGVGINRNLCLLFSEQEILLFADDDMVYYDDYEKLIINAFNKSSNADVIIFNFDFVRENGVKEPFVKKTKRIRLHNALRYGACSIAIKKEIVDKYNLRFSTLFGGGCIYGSGEDSLFILDCLKYKIKVFTDNTLIGKNICNKSSYILQSLKLGIKAFDNLKATPAPHKPLNG